MKKSLLYSIEILVLGCLLSSLNYVSAANNNLNKDLNSSVIVNVGVCDSTLSPEGIEVTFTQVFEPYDVFVDTTDDEGHVSFELPQANYYLSSNKPGFIDYFNEIYIQETGNDEYIMIQFTIYPIIYPVRNLSIDTTTNTAIWEKPQYVAFQLEDFEDETFPPPGWEVFQPDSADYPDTWERRNTSYPYWNIPAQNEDGSSSYFASIFEQEEGFAQDKPDWLIMPPVDLRLNKNFKLLFDIYFIDYFTPSKIMFSFDDGENWNLLMDMYQESSWQHQSIDLSGIQQFGDDLRNVKFAFKLSHEGNSGITRCAIDNVEIVGDTAAVEKYNIYLDDNLVGQNNPADTSFILQDLEYGKVYNLTVRNKGVCGESSPQSIVFSSGFLYPPKNLSDNYKKGHDFVRLAWNPPSIDTMISVNEDVKKQKLLGGLHLEHAFDLENLTGDNSNVGAGCDGKYIYSTSGNNNTIFKYDIHGDLIEEFNIEGVNSITDLAFDGVFMYGVNGSDVIYKMDFADKTLVATINLPLDAVAIAYDKINNAFWLNNISSDIYLFDENAICLDTISNSLEIHGLAYYIGQSENYLYAFCNNSSGQGEIRHYLLSDEILSNDIIQINNDLGSVTAGGLFISDNLYFRKTTIGGTAQSLNDPAIGFAYELANCPWPDDEVVPGIISFNIYRNDSLISNRPYYGEGVTDSVFFNDNDIEPGDYIYKATAIYDLAPYGFLGDTTESAYSNNCPLRISWGLGLPFEEYWDDASFAHNNWQAGDHWVIDNSSGNEAPSAKFEAFSSQTEYLSILESDYINSDTLSEGNIYLDFDIKLESLVDSATEYLKLEIKNTKNGSWVEIASFYNTASFDFTSKHFLLDSIAKNEIFKFRFIAGGHDAANISGWFIDNIRVSRLCQPPFNLSGEYVYSSQSDFGVEVCWEKPFNSPGNSSIIGYCEEPVQTWGNDSTHFYIAMRWDEGMLDDYAGAGITQIMIFPNIVYHNARYFIAYGDDASNEIYSAYAYNVKAGQWNQFVLDDTVLIDNNQSLWIGFEIIFNQVEPDALVCDAGPAVNGYGNKISFDGKLWYNASELFPELNANWALRAELAFPENTKKPETDFNSNKGLSGFNIFRKTEQSVDYQYYSFVAFSGNQTNYCYFDEYPAVDISKIYSYKVDAVYNGGLDYCESDFALDTEGQQDYVEVLVTKLNETTEDDMRLYPNPATEKIFIKTKLKIEKASLISINGKILIDSFDNSAMSMDISMVKPGIYILKLEAETALIFKKIIIK
ncbi:MAG: T9SS type A sorting domain-containing protein [Chlorobi bacterium]|nr:T9SS type A sorting domain-containing protein [Chlorobiota bacterium]